MLRKMGAAVKFAIGKYYRKSNGTQYINMGKDAPVPFNHKEMLKITPYKKGILIEPL